jgi:hypothetical protein
VSLGAKSAVARNCSPALLKRVEAAIPPTLTAVIRAPRLRMRFDRGKRERSEFINITEIRRLLHLLRDLRERLETPAFVQDWRAVPNFAIAFQLMGSST